MGSIPTVSLESGASSCEVSRRKTCRGEVLPTAGGVAEWLMAADCKSAGLTLYVGSNPTPTTGRARERQSRVKDREVRGCSSVGRASAFQAEGRGFEPRRPLDRLSGRDIARVAQLVEHILGKDEVTGSIPVMGSE